MNKSEIHRLLGENHARAIALKNSKDPYKREGIAELNRYHLSLLESLAALFRAEDCAR